MQHPFADSTHWRYAQSKPALALDAPRVLGILNVTPDSFSDGGTLRGAAHTAKVAAEMMEQGAVGVDIGGESTRPGAEAISAEEELSRVIPAIGAVRRAIGDGAVITIDTTKASVAQAALDAGADAINDISGGISDLAMLTLAARREAGVILMHRLRLPAADAYSTRYTPASVPTYSPAEASELPPVVSAVRQSLATLRDAAITAGIAREAIVLDPGLGFGKSVEDNLHLIRCTSALCMLDCPILSALSRKSFTAPAAGLPPTTPPAERLFGTLGLSAGHLLAGARLFRVHDVASHVQVLGAIWRTR